MKKKYGVVIYDPKSGIIAKGSNYLVFKKEHYSDPDNSKNVIRVHAEIDAIKKCSNKKQLARSYIYLVKYDENLGQMVKAYPCPDCQHTIDKYQLTLCN